MRFKTCIIGKANFTTGGDKRTQELSI